MMAVTAQRTSAQREARLRTGFGMLLGMLVLDSGPSCLPSFRIDNI